MKARQSMQAIRVGTRKLASPQSSSASLSSSSSSSSRSAKSDGARRSLSTKILGNDEKDAPAAAKNNENAKEDADADSLPRIIPSQQSNGTGVPIHLYTHDIEPQALEQVRRLAESPLPIDYVAVMPDAHLGKGVTIGTVFASADYVCPNAVGVDIGCGMAAIPIDNLFRRDLTDAQKTLIQQKLKERIPTGFSQHRTMLKGTKKVLDQITAQVKPTKYLQAQLRHEKVTDQLGTLGGGNHFLEVVHDDTPDEQVWCLLHSGSRNIGNKTALHYDQVARDWLVKNHKQNRRLQGIHYMPIASPEGQAYLRDMEWCQHYAYYNRKAMQDIMLEILFQVTGKNADLCRAVNIHHNYCQCEDCGDGRRLWVTRKGATSARAGEWGIIPGSMGTGSYITRGKGNLASWNSSSHGAGRRLSRTQAHQDIAQTDFEKAMRGIVCDTNPSVKDEAPQAYKDLVEVMRNQESLTEIVYKLQPLINVKGFEKKVPKKYTKKKKR